MKIEKYINISDYSNDDKNFFCNMIYYISDHIQSINRCGSYIKITFDKTYEKEVLENVRILQHALETSTEIVGLEESAKVEIETLEDYTNTKTINCNNVFDEMLKRNMIYPCSQGAYLYSDLFLKVFQYFEKKIDIFWKKNFMNLEKKEIIVPALMSIDEYEKGGYFQNFPHYMMFQSSLVKDAVTLSGLSNGNISSKEIGKYTKTPTTILRHAACAPVYAYCQDKIISKEQTFLVSGKCFRNEDNNTYELARLNEFFMKEYVFIGMHTDIERSINTAKKLWKFWRECFELNCKIDTANDSFFASNYKKMRLFQLLGDSKQEFKIYLPNEEIYIAAGSVNFHRTHFTKPYNIRSKQGYCHSACFAFGIERLAFGLLSQKGLDEDKWDMKTREEISKYVD